MPRVLIAALLDWLRGLRFPVLAAIAASVFALDLLIPDFIPFVDELMLGILTLLLASWRRHRAPGPVPAASPAPIERER